MVSGDFVLIVNFINYTNPTGLCAECNGGLEAFDSADQLTPVCCDESPFRSDNCDNTGEARCDTRFRWTIRPFNASLETRPVAVPGAAVPPYYFTNCDLSGATCPFSEMSTTFGQGPTGFLGVAANPLHVVSPPTLTSWPVSIVVVSNSAYQSTLSIHCIGKSAVLHRSSEKWTPQHNRQSVDRPGQPPTWGRLHRGDDIHWIPQHISHDHEFQSDLSKWFLW